MAKFLVTLTETVRHTYVIKAPDIATAKKLIDGVGDKKAVADVEEAQIQAREDFLNEWTTVDELDAEGKVVPGTTQEV